MTRFSVLEHLFSVLERLFPVLERPFPVFLFFWEGYFVPGRDGTEEFVPGHLLLPLSRDKGTPGQEFFFVPGQRDSGTSRPGLSRDVPRDVPSRGNPTFKGLLLAYSDSLYPTFSAMKNDLKTFSIPFPSTTLSKILLFFFAWNVMID